MTRHGRARSPSHRAAIVVVALASPSLSYADGHATSDQANEANNPLTPKITLNVQDQWAPELYGSDDETNALLLRGVIPLNLFGTPQLLRFTLPVTTAPTASGNTTGLGDLNLMDLFPFKAGSVEFAVGPQLTLPTASHDATGTGKWQAGLAAVVIAPQEWGMLGALVTWQTSFAGDEDRADQDTAALQPLVNVNLAKGWYLRSTATWTFDLERGTYAVPIGLGLGKVLALSSGTTVNLFAEPQWTVAHDGDGQPRFQVFAGVNCQLALHQ